jgi:hypothetical protein
MVVVVVVVVVVARLHALAQYAFVYLDRPSPSRTDHT